MKQLDRHPTDEEIELAVLNRLASADLDALAEHCVACMDCLRRLTVEEEFRQLARVACAELREKGEL